MRWWLAGCWVAWAGCVVVGEPNPQLSGTTGAPVADSSTTSAVQTSSSQSSSGGVGDPASSGETGEAPPIEAPSFEVLWTASGMDVMPPADSAGTIRTDAYGIPWVSFGSHPAEIEDRDALYAEIVAGIEAAIPEPAAEGYGVLPRPSWIPAWCDTSDTVRDAFAASPPGQGLSGAALRDAFEAEALEVLLEVLARARIARPEVKWGFHGIPAPEYWDIVEIEEDDTYEAWRTCNVSSQAPRQLWDAVDFTAPELRYFYPVGINGDYNASYVARWVEAMRLAGKPVYPLVTGRFLNSGSPGEPPLYVGLPYYPDDVELLLTELRNAGANGVIYDLELEGCWDFENGCAGRPEADPQGALEEYWSTAFSPVLATFDET